MTNLILHDFLVEHAKFPFPETSVGGTAASTTDISNFDVTSLDIQWKALHAVRDNDLAKKLCDTLKTTLGETPLTEVSKKTLLRYFLPALLEGWEALRWLDDNLSEADVSIILVPSL
jgi:hypothetical protein